MPENTVRELYIPMRDKVKLYTVLVTPAPSGKFPVIIVRTPYAAKDADPMEMKKEDTFGYALLTQHCRGTGRSEGICSAYKNERQDGLDLLDWIRKQSFYNGELFLQGGSYLASVHYSYLNTDPPDVKAAFLAVQDTERYNILYRNGFYKTGLHGGWVMGMYKRNQTIPRNTCPETFRTLPLSGITESIFHARVPEIEEEFLHPDPADGFWKTPLGGSDYHDAAKKCSVPILFVTAFYDIYLGGVMDMWKSLPPERRKKCACIVTPFDHAYDPRPREEKSPLPDFENGRLKEVFPHAAIRWFDHFRKNAPLSFIQKGKMTYFRLFENAWHTAETLENAEKVLRLYLCGNRTLSRKKPGSPQKITYDYNPFAPASFAGGVCNNFGGMQVQAPPNSRYDILSFISAPFRRDMDCEGKIELELHCSSTAPDSCFYVRLDLVRNGVPLSLRDDIDSLCRREKEYVPGKERVLKFVFAEHAFRIRKGDCLRLDVSSSCVPHFQVHTNRKGLLAKHTGADICRNTVITGSSFLKVFFLPSGK